MRGNDVAPRPQRWSGAEEGERDEKPGSRWIDNIEDDLKRMGAGIKEDKYDVNGGKGGRDSLRALVPRSK